VPAALGLITAAGGVCVALSGYASGGLVGLPFAGVAAGTLLVCLLFARSHSMAGVIGVGSVFLFGLLMAGRFFGDLTMTNFALLIVAPLLCGLIAVPPLRGFRAPFCFFAALVICLIPAGVAVGLAAANFASETSESSAYGDAASASDAPAFTPAPTGQTTPAGSGVSSLGSSKASQAPRDPSAEEPSSPTKRPPAPVDPGAESKN
jgi:hypothetical protein